jgi:hypothetical protein
MSIDAAAEFRRGVVHETGRPQGLHYFKLNVACSSKPSAFVMRAM